MHGEAYVAGGGKVFAVHMEDFRVRVAADWGSFFDESGGGKAGAGLGEGRST